MNWKDYFKSFKVLKPFDPFNSKLCTCPPKLSLNTYTGCGYECFYCYTSSYSFGKWGYNNTNWGAKKNLIKNLEKDIEKINKSEILKKYKTVALSLSSDPYPETRFVDEKELKLTRKTLKILTENDFFILIQTKSTLFLRDLDILNKEKTVIGTTITTFNKNLAKKIEKYAPPPLKRLKAIEKATNKGFKTIVRIDPLIPYLNTDLSKIESMVKKFSEIGISQLIFSTYKIKKDNFTRFKKIFPELSKKILLLYNTEKNINGYIYMKKNLREKLLTNIKKICLKNHILFSSCREGLNYLNQNICDGRGIIK